MTLQELKEQVAILSIGDRLSLVNSIIQSLQGELNAQSGRLEPSGQSSPYLPSSSIRGTLRADKAVLINRMRGFLTTDKPAPTDNQVQTMLEERLAEKYL